MMKPILAAGFALCAGGMAHASSLNVIDFEGLAAGTSIGGTTIGDVTFSTSADPTIFIGSTFGTTVLPGDTTSAFALSFNIGGVTQVSIDIGDFGSDSDDLFLRAYDEFDSLIGSDSDFLPSGVTSLLTLSVSTSADIARLEFGGIGQGGLNNVVFDNVSYTTATVIPLPAAGWMFLAGIGGLLAVRLSRKAAV